MTTSRSIFLSLALVAVGLQVVASIELIEMNDANKNELNLALSKALQGVQEAYMNEFKFATVKDIRNYLDQCEYVNHVMAESADSAFKGLAQKIKAIMADPNVSRACSVTSDELSADFDELDSGFDADKFDYLSTHTLNKLIKLRDQADANERLQIVVENVIALKAAELTEALLDSASDDVAVYIGEEDEEKMDMFDFDTKHKRLCETTLVEPICKLVRRSSQKVSVVAQDFDDYAALVSAKDEAKLKQYSDNSGVSRDQLVENCGKLKAKKMRAFKPVELIWSYVSAGFIDGQQVQQRMQTDSELASYNSLYNLCQLVA